MAKLAVTIRDYSNEYSSFALPVQEPADGAAFITLRDTEVPNLITAVQAITVGNVAKHHLILNETEVNDIAVTDKWAQREIGLRLFYEDTVNGRKGYVTIAAPDLDVVADANSDQVDLTGITAVNTLVTWMEANMLSRDGNAVQFYKGFIVGRRN
jgi:hypothetical protein